MARFRLPSLRSVASSAESSKRSGILWNRLLRSPAVWATTIGVAIAVAFGAKRVSVSGTSGQLPVVTAKEKRRGLAVLEAERGRAAVSRWTRLAMAMAYDDARDEGALEGDIATNIDDDTRNLIYSIFNLSNESQPLSITNAVHELNGEEQEEGDEKLEDF